MTIKIIIGGLGLSGKISPRTLIGLIEEIFTLQPALVICTLELGADLLAVRDAVGMVFIFERT
jgi:hypothetical protein